MSILETINGYKLKTNTKCMHIPRVLFDKFYDTVKPIVFWATSKDPDDKSLINFLKGDPEDAHHLFVTLCRSMYATGLDSFILKTPQTAPTDIEFSNAAGFNKNGEIPPRVLKYLGFDRVVVGTVTYDAWEGNPRPRIKRFPKTDSMVNWMGLPGIGAARVRDKLEEYGYQDVPITINLMATPKKKGDDALKDVEKTVYTMRTAPGVDSWEVNISCPNTHGQDGRMDARTENLRMLNGLVQVVLKNKLPNQRVRVKVSPDSTEKDVVDTLEVISPYEIGVVAANTTRNHHHLFIPKSPGKGGASGKAVYDLAGKVQGLYKRHAPNLEIIACGGIDSVRKAQARINQGATGIQLFTPLVYEGPKLLRELKQYKA